MIGDRAVNCGHCHTCGGPLRKVLDGEEWCDNCETYRRYVSHGWGAGTPAERAPFCPTADELEDLQQGESHA